MFFSKRLYIITIVTFVIIITTFYAYVVSLKDCKIRHEDIWIGVYSENTAKIDYEICLMSNQGMSIEEISQSLKLNSLVEDTFISHTQLVFEVKLKDGTSALLLENFEGGFAYDSKKLFITFVRKIYSRIGKFFTTDVFNIDQK